MARGVVVRSDASGFNVLPTRWLVPRTWSRLMRTCRLTLNHEPSTGSSEAVIHSSMGMAVSRRLALRDAGHPRRFGQPAPRPQALGGTQRARPSASASSWSSDWGRTAMPPR